jgi:probable HAF family extracellular repeat protein
VGASGTCAAFNSNTLLNLLPVHALLWDDGKAVDLGNLGGTTGQAGGNLAWAINDRGQVVGSSDLAGDATFHAFLWTNAAGMKDLGTLPGDAASSAAAINERGDVVGISLDQSFNPHAFLWQDGVMRDLNALVPANSSLVLLTACSVNSRREIAGLALTASGEFHAYLAIPEERVDHDDGP